MTAPRLRVHEIHIHERPVVLRLPFRFGVVTLRECPQAFAHVRVSLEGGGEAWGMSAEVLGPKWFDKSPELSNDENIEQLRTALRLAAEAYVAGAPATAFDIFRERYPEQIAEGGRTGLPPLAAGYGQALLDRAILDAACRARQTSLAAALKGNMPGLNTALTPDLDGFPIDGFLAGLKPLGKIAARHTVGMIDPLTAADQSPADRVGDGLPETLEEVIATYGVRHFKVKITGDVTEDTERLTRVAASLHPIEGDYIVSLDGNEQYTDEDGVVELLTRLDELHDPAMRRFLTSMAYIEQPITRAVSLDTPVHRIAARAPLIIDESDGTVDAFPRHRSLGYSGVSSKTCKGFYKSILNAARCTKWTAENDGRTYFLSGEDLTCQAGLALQQDLALVSVLGIEHVERNGHHYTHGMSGAPDEEQARFLATYPDLYESRGGITCARIDDGVMSTKSVLDSIGWASAEAPNWPAMTQTMSFGGA